MRSRARDALARKAKPPGSLGRLEAWAERLSILQNTLKPRVDSAHLLIFAADHGITRHVSDVSAYPRQVTPAMFAAIEAGKAASNVLSGANGVKVILVDVGVDGDVARLTCSGTDPPSSQVVVRHCKVSQGSSSFLEGPAMTQEEVEAAMNVGKDTVNEVLRGEPPVGAPVVLCLGELGIGNTTCAAALVAALTGVKVEDVCGHGTGVDDRQWRVKVHTISRGLEVNQELIDPNQPLGVLRAVGGLEVAALVGAFLEAGRRKVAVVVDGFIAGAAALVAVRMAPGLKDCLFPSHLSAEKGATVLLEALDIGPPVLDMKLRLGEGTGAVMCVPLLRSAAAIMAEMATLEDVMAGMQGRAE